MREAWPLGRYVARQSLGLLAGLARQSPGPFHLASDVGTAKRTADPIAVFVATGVWRSAPRQEFARPKMGEAIPGVQREAVLGGRMEQPDNQRHGHLPAGRPRQRSAIGNRAR